jgi:hypothetical protein
VFPQADLYFCEWHLKPALDRLLKKLCGDEPDHRADFELLRGRLDAAFTGLSFWRPFTADAHAVDSRRLSAWRGTTGAVLEAQFARRGLSTSRSPDTPLSTSPIDASVTPIRDAIRPRAYALKNRERTNRKLMLMQLYANRQDDERTYAKHIRLSHPGFGGDLETRTIVLERGTVCHACTQEVPRRAARARCAARVRVQAPDRARRAGSRGP